MASEIVYESHPLRYCRSFHIRKIVDGEVVSLYRTFRMSKDEFEAYENATANDWKAYLKCNNVIRLI